MIQLKPKQMQFKRWLTSVFTLLVISLTLSAQNTTIQGVVSDDLGSIPGVTIQVKGSSTGTITDVNGKYSIASKKGDVLVFSFIGMETQNVTVTGSHQNVKMASSSIGLDEVVAIGYGTVKKKELTGAVAQVKAEDISRMVTADVGSALQGLVAGVNVTNSGSPGESASILIRGITSIDGSNTPLYVVDGIPQEGDPRLSPQEIQTIDILKDAASCAIYGTRGAAGVILITTKQGKAGSLRVSVDANYGIQNITSSTFLMNAEDQSYSEFLFHEHGGYNFDEMNLRYLRSDASFQNNNDLSEIIFVDYAPVQSYNAMISGGTEELTYSLTAGYYDQEGIIINSNFERFNMRANTTYKHGKWRINGSVGMIIENRDRTPSYIITQTIKYQPTMPAIDLDSEDVFQSSGVGGSNESTNASWVMETLKNTDESKTNTSLGNLNLNYEILKGLNFGTRIGVRASNVYRKRFDPFNAIIDSEGTMINDPIKDSGIQMDASRNLSFTWDGSLTYRKNFNKSHHMTAVVAQSVERYQYDSFWASRSSVDNNTIQVLNGSLEDQANGSGNNYVNKLVGTLGRLQYDYKSKYLFSASLRRDGSSKFADDNRWGIFPSASAAWNVSDERFWHALEGKINNFKIRASYGSVGNQSFPAYRYSTGIVNGIDYTFSNNGSSDISYGAAMTGYANADVKWETSIQGNYGIDLGFFKNKVTLTAEYYNTHKKDMLMPIQVPASNGSLPSLNTDYLTYSTVYLNVGNMTNQGIELAASYKAATGKINWNFTGTFSTNNNEVTKLNNADGDDYLLLDDGGLVSGRQSTSQITAIAKGHEAGAFYLFKTDGIANTEALLAEYQKIDPLARLGDVMYKDHDGDGTVRSAGDREYAGSGLAEYEVGFSVRADYKDFDFSMQWYSAIGHEVMNGSKATAYSWGRHQDLVSQYSPANPTSNIPAYRGEPSNNSNYNGYTDLWLEDGTFLRLKEVTLGYTVSDRLVKKANLKSLRFYVSAQNPLTFTNYTGYDPEVGGSLSSKGLDKGNYPISSIYTVGLNLKF